MEKCRIRRSHGSRSIDLSLQCCKYRSTKSFSVSLLREMNRLVPFDEAVVFYLNGNLKITDYYLYNINPKWMSL